MNIKDTAREICAIPGPSGFEQQAAERIAELLRPLVDRVTVDSMGNVIGLRRAENKQANAKKLLLDAHMDEIGFIVTEVKEGFLKFSAIGGVDPRTLPGREVTVMADKPLYGVIACLPPHLLTADEKEKIIIEIKDLFIDLGLSEEEAKTLVPVGTPGVFRGDFTELLEGSFASKALDDRLCVAVLLQVMENIKDLKLDFDVYFMASVQEEVGIRGAGPGAFAIEPDYCIAVDVTYARQPETTAAESFKPGSGAAIAVGPNASRALTQVLMNTAKEHKIPYTTEVMPGNSGTNGWAVQVSRQGVATAMVSVPVKYMHSPVETVRLSDAEAACSLITEYIKGGTLT
jgi:endoglucanase